MADRYAELRAAQQSIGASDWQWWDSNSFRRLTFIEANGRHGQDGGALCAVVHPIDGHPDVQMASGVREFIETCSPDTIRALLADYDRLREALRWNAGALQACCSEGIREASNITIKAETKCFAEILDAANAALAQEAHDAD